MDIIITGAAGWGGQTLASALLAGDHDIASITLTDNVEPEPPQIPPHKPYICVRCVQADLMSFPDCEKLFTKDIDVAYLLHAERAEADLDFGLGVNVDSMRQILDIMRRHGNPSVRVIFGSSLAVYGPNTAGVVVSEETMPLPRCSYGAQQLMTETLLNDYSRRGLVDGRILRMPTFARPSDPKSSFKSEKPREPLKGQDNIVPMRKDLKLWIGWSRILIENLIKAMYIPKEKYAGRHSRTVNMPGQTVTLQEMLDESEEMNEEQVRELLETLPDRVDTAVAKSLGFTDDVRFMESRLI